MKHLVVCACLLVAAVTPASAERQLVDRIVAVVEDEAIFQSDVEQMVSQYLLQQGQSEIGAEERKQLEARIIEDLINDKLVIAQANRLDVTIPFEEVEARVNEAIEENTRMLGGEEAFLRQLEREGFTMEGLKKLYRTQIYNRMLVERVLRMEMQNARNADASDEALRRLYEERKDMMPARPEVVQLRTIFVGFGTATNALESAKTRIDDIHGRLEAGESFASLASQFSEDPSKAQGGDLGFVKPEDLSEPAFAAAAASLDVGEISEPVLTSFGYHVLKVTERNPDTDEIRLSHILVRAQPDEEDIAEVYRLASSIHERLVAGAPFDSLANRYNTDPSTSEGGDLGWLKVEDLPEFFRDVLRDMKPGDVSPVLRESSGFRIVKLIDREERRPYEFEEVRQRLRQMYENEKMGEMYAEYVDGLREKFSVDVK